MSKRRQRVESVPIVYPNAAGLASGSGEIYACKPPDRGEDKVKVFGTFTADLKTLADWLATTDVDTVAMESTGVYWVRCVRRESRF